MTLQELEELKARRETGVLIDRLKWAEILDWAIVLTAHHESVDKTEKEQVFGEWIDHIPGTQPVADDVMVDVFTREELDSGHAIEVDRAGYFDWSTTHAHWAIIKYRIVK